MKKLRILHIFDNMWVGGAQKAFVQIENEIDKSRFKIYVCCINGKGFFFDKLKTRNVYFIDKKRSVDISLIFRIRRLIKDKKIDVVVTHLDLGNLYGRMAAVLCPGVKLVSVYHGIKKFPKIVFIVRRLLSLFNSAFLAVSKSTLDYYILNENACKKKSKVIYNGVDIRNYRKKYREKAEKEFGFEKGIFAVGFVGRLNKIKNLPCFLNAAKIFSNKVKNSRFIIVGDGPERKKLELMSERIGLKNVIFTGYRSDVAEIISSFDVSVLPSLHEGCPNFILESMASGKPVIASRAEGNTELIEDCKNGFLFNSKKPSSLADLLFLIYCHPEIGKKIGIEGVESVKKKFSFEKMKREYELFFEKFLDNKKGVYIG